MVPMNPSERLHNQGDKEQVMTPELKLSMELRDKCEQLLQEKGNAKVDLVKLNSLINPAVLPVGIIIMMVSGIRQRSMPSLSERVLILVEGENNKPAVKIVSNGTTIPSRAREITIHIPELDDSPADINVLKLERGQKGKIETMHILNFQFYGRDPNTTKKAETRLATMEELEAYRRHITQSSPIEHK